MIGWSTQEQRIQSSKLKLHSWPTLSVSLFVCYARNHSTPVHLEEKLRSAESLISDGDVQVCSRLLGEGDRDRLDIFVGFRFIITIITTIPDPGNSRNKRVRRHAGHAHNRMTFNFPKIPGVSRPSPSPPSRSKKSIKSIKSIKSMPCALACHVQYLLQALSACSGRSAWVLLGRARCVWSPRLIS